MADVTYIPEQGNNNNILPWMLASQNGGWGGNNVWPWLLAGGGGLGGFGGFGGAGLGGGILGFLLGALVGNNGWGGLFGGGNGAGLGNQINNNNNTDTVLRAIDGTDADVRLLATTLNADVNEVRNAISQLQLAAQNVGSQVGMTGLQVINAIQSGDASLASQLCQCCCEMRQLTVEQGYQNRIQTIEQTNQLGSQADRNTAAITGSIADLKTTMVKEFCDARERDMQAKIDTQADLITQLRSKADNAEQTQRFMGAFAMLDQKITELAAKQPQTVPVQWPNLAAVNTTPYVSGGFYGNPFGNGWGGWNGFGNGFGNGFNF